jgi:pyruvate formate lyase activating enzyme
VLDGWVFDVQRFSTHDGPGIRTTVFLKGCGLRCLWCHNPESWAGGPQIQIYGELCIACGRCIEVCEPKARSMDDGRVDYDRDRCKQCGACAEACPAEAVKMSGRRMTVQEVLDEVLRDRPFYESSNGGVTLSGGEPLLQPEFSAAVLERCLSEGLHTAIETAAHVPWSAFEKVLPFVKFVFLDVKLIDGPRHRDATGRDNDLILENARRLGACPVPVVVRMPVIPGINDSPEDVREVARFAKSLPNVQALELMRFHALGTRKARSLGYNDWAAGRKAPSAESMDELLQIGTEEGLDTRLG